MLLSEMPGHKYPVIAIFPFRWYETNRWIIRALKLRPNDELSWMDHSIESNGHAKAQTFGNYEDAREEATAFNLGIATRVAALAAASAPALAAAQVPDAMGVPLSMEYRPRRATKFSGSRSLRKVRTGQTDGNGCTPALAGSRASQCCQAVCKKAK